MQHGIHREAGSVTAQIEHSPACFEVPRRLAPVLALVEKEAGLLSLDDVDCIAQSMFFDKERAWRFGAAQQAIGDFEPLGGADAALGS